MPNISPIIVQKYPPKPPPSRASVLRQERRDREIF
jgi:hypothetical protein